jgi:hypothetical protein
MANFKLESIESSISESRSEDFQPQPLSMISPKVLSSEQLVLSLKENIQYEKERLNRECKAIKQKIEKILNECGTEDRVRSMDKENLPINI